MADTDFRPGRTLSPGTFYPQKQLAFLIPGRFYLWNKLSRECFITRHILAPGSFGIFYPLHFLSLEEFIPSDTWHFLSQEHFIMGIFYPWKNLSWEYFIPGRIYHGKNLSLEEFITGRFYHPGSFAHFIPQRIWHLLC